MDIIRILKIFLPIRMRGKKTFCRECGIETSFSKPFCVDHSPYAQKLKKRLRQSTIVSDIPALMLGYDRKRIDRMAEELQVTREEIMIHAHKLGYKVTEKYVIS